MAIDRIFPFAKDYADPKDITGQKEEMPMSKQFEHFIIGCCYEMHYDSMRRIK